MQDRKLVVFVSTLAFLIGISAHAQDPAFQASDPYFEIGAVNTTVTQQAVIPLEQVDLPEVPKNEISLPTLFIDPMAIAQVLLKVWDIVVANKPVVSAETKTATALPVLAQNNWALLTGWKPERAIEFSTTIENGFGMKVVDLHYQVRLLYGGGVHGKGLYIASAQATPTSISVLWAYNLNVSVTVDSIVNAGTDQNPLAQIKLSVAYKYGNVLRSDSGSNRYLLRADGLLKDDLSGKVYFTPDPSLARVMP